MKKIPETPTQNTISRTSIDAPNVQEKILEYKDRSKKRFFKIGVTNLEGGVVCPTKSNCKFKLSNLEDSKWKTFKSNCVVNIELLKFVKTNKTSDPVKRGSVLWPENISVVTENTSIVARQPALRPVNVSIPRRIPVLRPENQYCSQTVSIDLRTLVFCPENICTCDKGTIIDTIYGFHVVQWNICI
ncbi:hypothetical protein Avbf_18596 [Armadillidium vulgare]|nr:hypothetical protein Avbf_18596 [Armadillidium vulgare]